MRTNDDLRNDGTGEAPEADGDEGEHPEIGHGIGAPPSASKGVSRAETTTCERYGTPAIALRSRMACCSSTRVIGPRKKDMAQRGFMTQMPSPSA